MSKSKIEWCDRTWNPVTGCTQISAGCANCYAKRMSERFAGPWGLDPKDPFKVTLRPERLEEPLRWKKPSKVFVCSMSDLFHDDVPEKFIIDALSVMAEAWQHTFLILTKRPERMAEIFKGQTVANDVWLQTSRGVNAEKSPWPLPNVWLGVTAESQEQADKRIPILLQIPAAKRFVSVEPMLGPVDLNKIVAPHDYREFHFSALHEQHDDCYWQSKNLLGWVICGGESGPNARPMQHEWARSLRDQCQAAGTPFLFKQWGEWCPNKPGTDAVMLRVGKKTAGRLLDGELWDQYPEVPS